VRVVLVIQRVGPVSAELLWDRRALPLVVVHADGRGQHVVEDIVAAIEEIMASR
jgi:hypothetical protein